MKAFYSVTTDNAIKIDICRGLVMRLHDEDDTVKDLAVKTLEELGFSYREWKISEDAIQKIP